MGGTGRVSSPNRGNLACSYTHMNKHALRRGLCRVGVQGEQARRVGEEAGTETGAGAEL